MRHIASGLSRASLLAACTLSGSAAADQIAYEGFDYSPKPNLTGSAGGSGWAGPWSDVGAIPTAVTAPGLEWPNLLSVGSGAYTPGSTSFELTTYQRPLAAYSAPAQTLYLSFLLRPDSGFGTGGGLRFGNWPNAMWVGAPPGYYVYGLMTSNGLGDFSNVDVVAGQTTLVVVRIVKNTSTGKLVYTMWIDPEVGEPQPQFAAATYSIGGNLPTAVTLVNDGGLATDEIRLGTTWDDVMPTAPACLGDFNGDGLVTAADLGFLLAFWELPDGDLDGDGITNGADLGLLLGNWGGCP